MAEITERQEIGTGVTKPERLTLERDGIVRQACFKRIDVKQQDSWRSEIAAYELDKLLGLRSSGRRRPGLASPRPEKAWCWER